MFCLFVWLIITKKNSEYLCLFVSVVAIIAAAAFLSLTKRMCTTLINFIYFNLFHCVGIRLKFLLRLM